MRKGKGGLDKGKDDRIRDLEESLRKALETPVVGQNEDEEKYTFTGQKSFISTISCFRKGDWSFLGCNGGDGQGDSLWWR